MTNQYNKLKTSPLWLILDKAIQELENKYELAIINDRDLVIGYIANAIEDNSILGLTQSELEAVMSVLGMVGAGDSKIEDWEFQTLIGYNREDFKNIVNKLYPKDTSSE